MSDNMKLWNSWCRPDPENLKKITGGRLSGMTDIKPIYRLKMLTEQLGVCGFGWKYTIDKQWLYEISDGQVAAFCNVSLFTREKGGVWSEGIPGTGGSMLVAKERNGMHFSDEAHKMALTDALSVACLRLGVAADIYAGQWDGSKYKDNPKVQYSPAVHPDGQVELVAVNEWGVDGDPAKRKVPILPGLSKATEVVPTGPAPSVVRAVNACEYAGDLLVLLSKLRANHPITPDSIERWKVNSDYILSNIYAREWNKDLDDNEDRKHLDVLIRTTLSDCGIEEVAI